MRPFRFGIEAPSLPYMTWRKDLEFIENVGYSSILWTDHFGNQWEPTVSMATTAAVTSKLKTGTMVYCVDYHHPTVLAQAAATAQVLSNGRIEFGIGAGWMKSDYTQTGIQLDKPETRIKKMEEAIKIIKTMWRKKTSFTGKYYKISDIPKSPSLDEIGPPPILVGGGGKKVLSVAGKHANIVNIISGLQEGRVTKDFFKRCTLGGYHRRIGYLKYSIVKAGRKIEDIELSTLTLKIKVTDDPDSAYVEWAKDKGLTVKEVKNIPTVFIGSAREIKEKLHAFRDDTGINYIVLAEPKIEEVREFGEHIVKEMTGK